MKRKAQAGLTVVEFAVIGAVFMMVLFGCIEISRLLYTWNTLAEASRAGARIATVCPVNDNAVLKAAILNEPSDGAASKILHNLTTSKIDLDYLDAAGAELSGPNTWENARFVRVSITGYTITLLIPFMDLTLTAPPFTTTLPRESLGYVPEEVNPICLLPA